MQIKNLYELEKMQIKKALEAYGYNLSKAAPALGIGRATLYAKVKMYGLK